MAGPLERVRGQRGRGAAADRLLGHRAASAVRVEDHAVGIRLPGRVERERGAVLLREVRDGPGHGVRAVRRAAPAAEAVAGAGEARRRRQVERLAPRAERHRRRSGAAVGVVAHEVGDRAPYRVERHGGARRVREVEDGLPVRVERVAAGRKGPALEDVPRAPEREATERLLLPESESLRGHRPGAALRLERHGVVARGVVGETAVRHALLGHVLHGVVRPHEEPAPAVHDRDPGGGLVGVETRRGDGPLRAELQRALLPVARGAFHALVFRCRRLPRVGAQVGGAVAVVVGHGGLRALRAQRQGLAQKRRGGREAALALQDREGRLRRAGGVDAEVVRAVGVEVRRDGDGALRPDYGGKAVPEREGGLLRVGRVDAEDRGAGAGRTPRHGRGALRAEGDARRRRAVRVAAHERGRGRGPRVVRRLGGAVAVVVRGARRRPLLAEDERGKAVRGAPQRPPERRGEIERGVVDPVAVPVRRDGRRGRQLVGAHVDLADLARGAVQVRSARLLRVVGPRVDARRPRGGTVVPRVRVDEARIERDVALALRGEGPEAAVGEGRRPGLHLGGVIVRSVADHDAIVSLALVHAALARGRIAGHGAVVERAAGRPAARDGRVVRHEAAMGRAAMESAADRLGPRVAEHLAPVERAAARARAVVGRAVVEQRARAQHPALRPAAEVGEAVAEREARELRPGAQRGAARRAGAVDRRLRLACRRLEDQLLRRRERRVDARRDEHRRAGGRLVGRLLQRGERERGLETRVRVVARRGVDVVRPGRGREGERGEERGRGAEEGMLHGRHGVTSR